MPKSLDDKENTFADPTEVAGETVQIKPEESIFGGETISGQGDDDAFARTQVDDTGFDPKSTIVDEQSGRSLSAAGSQLITEADNLGYCEYVAPVKDDEGESSLAPSLRRSVLVYTLFVFVGLWMLVNIYQVSRIQTEIVDWKSTQSDGRVVVDSVAPSLAGLIKPGDQITALEGEPVVRNGRVGQLLERLKPEQEYALRIRSGDGAERDVKLTAPESSLILNFNKYFINLVIPLAFFLTGLLAFFFSPTNKLVYLMAVTFALLTIATPVKPLAKPEMNAVLSIIWSTGTAIGIIFAPTIFYLHLLFPSASKFVLRYPVIGKLLYLPCLLLTVPVGAMWQLSQNGFSQFDFSIDQPIFTRLYFIPHTVYLIGALVNLIVNYFLTDRLGKRRIRFLAAGVMVAVGPYLSDKILRSLEFSFDFHLFADNGTRFLMSIGPTALLPLVFAYAIVRHKVIPVSFVIRRGVQYLLTKNAIRVLLLLPVFGIIWNAAANPERPLSELLFRNSLGFYACIAVAGFLLLLNRFGLREWVDSKFFRRQYDEEEILDDLAEKITEVDSVEALSRLVSDKIQDALHPSSVYLFFRDDETNSDFSLCYTTGKFSNTDIKLPVDSPILSFMESERQSVGFDDDVTDELPPSEKGWLRSLGANLLVPMHGTNGKLAGFFTLGEKLSEIPYTGRDRELLESLANQIALMHENLTLKDRVRQEQKIRSEVLSRVDASSLNLLKECPKCGRCYDREDEHCLDDKARLTFTLPVERTIDNRYQLERLIGKGGMGAVYEALDRRINRVVAVKILSGAMFGNREALRRFEREAQTAGRIQHQNIVTVFDYGVLTTEGAFLVMELVRGESLRHVLKKNKQLSRDAVFEWFGQILDGLAAAHTAGVIHRDLKPENILVTQSESGADRLCILDFGLARHQELSDNVTNPGTIMGTLGYMSPEQLSGERADERSDLFSVSVMIHEAAFGEKPFLGKSFIELMNAMTNGYRPAEAGPLTDFLERGLSYHQHERYASAKEMKSALSFAETK